MEWRFWKWGKKGKSRAENAKQASRPTAQLRLSKPYAERQILAMQRTVGNQAVLRWLGLR